ncbi:MAG: hypothetical protein A07HR60_01670 [uncultured archaeon A07HR60]|nr:MAG: hypothetical protein A07HR60_01670 [uncultured archaeon A07HR60]
MPRGRSEDALFRDDERRSLSNHVTPWMKPTLSLQATLCNSKQPLCDNMMVAWSGFKSTNTGGQTLDPSISLGVGASTDTPVETGTDVGLIQPRMRLASSVGDAGSLGA